MDWMDLSYGMEGVVCMYGRSIHRPRREEEEEEEEKEENEDEKIE